MSNKETVDQLFDEHELDIVVNLAAQAKKISLYPWGMDKLVREWLESGHNLTRVQKDSLIKPLK